MTVLGSGAYLLAERNTTTGGGAVHEVDGDRKASPGPSAPDATAAAVPETPALAPGKPLPSRLAEQLNRERQQAASAPPAVPGLHSTTTGSLKTGILRVITARGNLTGVGEMAWVAGGVTEYRGKPCTQTFRFAPGAPVQVKRNLLMCWWVSATKSVVTIVVDDKGHPSRSKAVGALLSEWRRMG